jgi:hypothetical protein
VVYKVALFIAFLSLSGCATTANYEKILNSWVGGSEEKLIMSWGAPAGAYQITDSKKAIVYQFNGGASTYGSVNAYTGLYSGYTVANSCKTTFFVDSGTVASWRWEGNSCRAEAPREPHPPDAEKKTLMERAGFD